MSSPSAHDTLLARWLSDDLSEAEAAAVEEMPERKDYERLLAATQRLSPPAYDAQQELARFKAGRKAAKTPTLHPRSRPLMRRLYPWIGAAAAAVALLLTAWLLWPTTVVAPNGQMAQAELSDGSSIRLNAGSTLDFENGEEKRLATLSGEGFFEVVKSDIPFVVQTELGTITVVGTAFNVYQRDGELRVSCSEGQVRVDFTGKPRAYPLTPGNSVAISAAGEVSTGPTDEEETLDWLEGRSIFDDRPLEQVLSELERQFDLQISRPAGLNLQQEYRANFSNADVDLALSSVFDSFNNLSYERNGKIVTLRLDN
ncbi:MAG: FecR domain-containing protein [Bacteroidota bacterium]